MKRVFFVSMITVLFMASTALYAQERASLGKTNFAVKLDYIVFTDDHFDEPGNEDDGLYVGLEGYGEIAPNIYFGGEIGQAVNINAGGDDISFFPVELNMKYAIETSRDVVADFGAGLSYSYVELRYRPLSESARVERDDWLFGGQFFADLTYKFHRFSFGINAKYQIIDDFRGEPFDLTNFRFGVQIGAVF